MPLVLPVTGPAQGYPDILCVMAKILVSLDERLLRRIDAAARRLGLTRSAYLARLAQREIGSEREPAEQRRIAEATAAIRRLFAEHGTGGDTTKLIRRIRDERTRHLARRVGR